IQPRIIESSIRRYRWARLNARELGRRIGENDRSRFVTIQQKRARYRTLLAETGDPRTARAALERLIGGNDLVGINYLERGLAAARSVCRIHLRGATGDTTGFGTGFLVAPGVLITNHHVIAAPGDARNALAEFDYELDGEGSDKPVAHFAIVSDRVLS